MLLLIIMALAVIGGIFAIAVEGLRLIGGAIIVFAVFMGVIAIILFIQDKLKDIPDIKRKVQGCIVLVILILFCISVIYMIVSFLITVVTEWDMIVIDFESLIEDFKAIFQK